MTGDGLVRPLNAPGGATTPVGIQPGAPSAIIANRVVIFGPGSSGLFVYDGTPALGNPPILSITDSSTDPYGNPVQQYLATRFGAFGVQVTGTGISLTDGSTDAIIDMSPDGTLQIFPPTGGIATGELNAFEPGTLGLTEFWHPMTLLNGWTAGAGLPPSYRYLASPPDTVEIAGSLNGSASLSSVFAQLPAGYQPENTQEGWLAPTTLAATGQYFFQAGTDGNIAVEGGTLTYNFNFHGFLSLIAGTNVPLAISAGGTGATTAIAALQNLGAAAGLNIQYLDFYGADNTGATFSDTAMADAIAALGANPGFVMAGVGIYKFADPITLGANQGIKGPGSPYCQLNFATAADWFLTVEVATFNDGAVAGLFGGFTSNGPYSGGTGFLRWGNLQALGLIDVKLYGYDGGVFLLYYVGDGGYGEQAFMDQVLISECGGTSGFVFGVNGNGAGPTGLSCDYVYFNGNIVVEKNISIFNVINNGQIQGGELHGRSNLHAGTSNTGAIFNIGNSSGDESYVTNISGSMSFECNQGSDTGTVGHFTVKMNSNSGASQFLWLGNFYAYPAGGTSQGQYNAGGPIIAISGRTNAPDGTQMTAGTAHAFIGSTAWDPRFANFGGLYLGINVYWELADTQAALLGNGANGTLVFNGADSFVRKGTLLLKQPASGAPGTVLYPANVLWIGGPAPTLQTTNGWTDEITCKYIPATGTWYLKYEGAYHG